MTKARVRVKSPDRGHSIDFRHVIGNLRRKPQALRYLVYRDALFPSHAYLRAWQAFDAKLEARNACRDMVALLDIAARGNCIDALALRIDAALDSDRLPDIGKLTAEFLPISRARQDVTIPPPDHAAYMPATEGAAAQTRGTGRGATVMTRALQSPSRRGM